MEFLTLEPGILTGVTGFAAYAGAILFLIIAGFQIALAAGMSWGEFAWGGKHRILPVSLRIASALASVFYLLNVLVALEEGAITELGMNPALTGPYIGVLAGLFALGIPLNLISRSGKERRVMTPVAFLCCLCCLVLALNTRL